MAKKRLEIMKDVVAGKISVPTAAVKLGRSVKTVQRYRKELLENPRATLEHKNSGREPARPRKNLESVCPHRL